MSDKEDIEQIILDIKSMAINDLNASDFDLENPKNHVISDYRTEDAIQNNSIDSLKTIILASKGSSTEFIIDNIFAAPRNGVWKICLQGGWKIS